MKEASDDAEALDDRLQRLAERRRMAVRRHVLRSSSSEEGEAQDAQPSRPPQGSALQALRELLQERQEVLQAAGTELAGVSSAEAACRQCTITADAAPPAAAVAALPDSAPSADQLSPEAELSSASSSGARDNGPPSVPATARALISLSTAIGQQEAQAEQQARTAEAREAETAVHEAQVCDGRRPRADNRGCATGCRVAACPLSSPPTCKGLPSTTPCSGPALRAGGDAAAARGCGCRAAAPAAGAGGRAAAGAAGVGHPAHGRMCAAAASPTVTCLTSGACMRHGLQVGC